MYDDLGYPLGRAKVLSSRGLVLEERGERRLAIVAWQEAMEIFRYLGASESSKVEAWLRDRDNGR